MNRFEVHREVYPDGVDEINHGLKCFYCFHSFRGGFFDISFPVQVCGVGDLGFDALY